MNDGRAITAIQSRGEDNAIQVYLEKRQQFTADFAALPGRAVAVKHSERVERATPDAAVVGVKEFDKRFAKRVGVQIEDPRSWLSFGKERLLNVSITRFSATVSTCYTLT